jgi:hypothetical protein
VVSVADDGKPGVGDVTDGTEVRPPRPSFLGFVLRLILGLAVIAGSTALYAVWEASSSGFERFWIYGVLAVALPVLWFVGEATGNPVIDLLESYSWWRRAASEARIVVGVLVLLPFFAFLAVSLAFFRHLLGVPQ